MRHILLFLSAFALPALAQFEGGSVLGTVRDKASSVVPEVRVTLTNPGTGIAVSTVTDGNGNYEFPSVRIGTYTVTAEKAGFAKAVASGVAVNVAARQRVDLELTIGAVEQTIEVVGAAALIETDTSQRSQIISQQAAVSLPFNGREYSSVVLLSSGVRASAIGTGSTLTPREGSFNINGLRSTFNNYMLDGLDNNAYGTSNQGFSNQVIQPPPDSVAQVQVVTNNESAEYGRAAGATINVAYASGTNQLHIALWEFVRNTSLNAVGFFRPRIGTVFPFHRNQFGGAVGGPIVRNRAFFFLDYEGFRQIRNIPSFLNIPTLAQRQGIFPVAITNPLTGRIYPANTPIPQADWQPYARKVLAELALPSSSAASNNYQLSQSYKNFNDKYNAKFDYQLTAKLNGFTRLGQRKVNAFDQPPLPLPSGGAGNAATRVLNQQLATGVNWARSSNQVIEFRFGVSRTQAGKNPAALGTPNANDLYGIPGLPTDPRISGGLPTQLVSGFADMGRQATNPQWQYPTMFNPKLNYSRIMGRHSLRAGYEFVRVHTEVQDVNPLYGRDTYSSAFSGNNLADFMFGLRSQYALSTFFIANMRQNLHFLYLQDDFKLSPKLTLNLGVRYEYATPQWERDNKLTNFDPNGGTLIPAKAGGMYDRSLVHPDRNNFAPRIGFAYLIDSKTVVRSGFGASYVHFHRSGAANLLPINGPQVVNAVVNQSPAQPGFLTTQQGYPTGLASPDRFNPVTANITYMPADTRTTYVNCWFLSVQRQLTANTMIDVAYVGNRANKILLFANYNQAQPNQPGQSLTLAQRQNTRPFPTFGDITYAFNGGGSSYNSLQLRAEHRFGHGLFFLNSFTWSKAIDTGAGSLENPNGNFPSPQDFNNLRAEKALSAYDQPLTNITTFIYQLPFGKGRRFASSASRALDLVIGGWELSGINSAYSGPTVTLTYTPGTALQVSGIAQDFRGANNYRVNITGDPVNHGDNHILNFWNRANIVVPTDPSRPFGNAGRNIARGDAFWQVDLAALKNFQITERARLQFRTEVFNVLNHTNFLPPSSNCSTFDARGTCTLGSFGTITGTLDPRLIQLGLKLNW